MTRKRSVSIARRPSTLESFLFTTLATAASAAGAALAVRAVEVFWRKVRHEPPPETSKLAAFLLGAPLGKVITRRLRAA